MDINEIKKEEISDIRDFLDTLDDYGHIYYYEPDMLDGPFKKIMEGIEEVHKLMNDSYEM